jgi:hypothetical protein
LPIPQSSFALLAGHPIGQKPFVVSLDQCGNYRLRCLSHHSAFQLPLPAAAL